MVALLFTLTLSLLMVGVIIRVGQTRKAGTPLTWGEAFVAALFIFTLLFLVYGVVPHHWLAWADNDLKWRSDKIGVPLGPIGKAFDAKDNVVFGSGVPLPNGRFIITAQVLRDIVAATLYIVFLVGQILLWLWWQKGRITPKDRTAELTSAFGRPLVRKT